jgi:GDPmannose 4,6-dehydratase
VTRKITHTAAQIKMGMTNELRLGNLDARRDWGYAGDYVRAIWGMLQRENADDYVIGTGSTHSVREFCELAFDYLDLDYREHVIQDPRYYRPVEPAQLVADPRKALRDLDWAPKMSFEELVREMVASDLESLASEGVG